MSGQYPHLTQYAPPIPAIELTLHTSSSQSSVGPLSALVDTGADITLIPLIHLEQLGAPERELNRWKLLYWNLACAPG